VDLGHLQSYKNNVNPEARFSIPIADDDGKRIGALVCLDRELASHAEIIGKLTQWRSRTMRYFLTQFVATNERTLSWVNRTVLPASDRILFLLYCAQGDLVGNSGVCNLRPGYGELDNLIRGERGGDPKLVYYSEIALLSWLYGVLGCQKVGLHVFADNRRTIALHSSVGFAVVRTHKLSVTENRDGKTYLVNSPSGQPAAFAYLEMELAKASFLSAHPWVRSVYKESI
jgi:hypothetical protein